MTGIIDPKLKEYAFTVKDFTEINGDGVNVRVKKDGVFPAFYRGEKKEGSMIVTEPSFYYEAGSNEYVYCKNKYIFKLNTGSFVSTSKFNSRPEQVTVENDGESYDFFVSSNLTYSVNGNNTFPFKGTSAIIFYDSLFAIENGEVKFSEPFGFLDENGKLKADGFYRPEEPLKSALRFARDFDKLYILCEKGIVTVEAKGNFTDYTFKGTERKEQNITENSHYSFGDKLFFLENGSFCVYDGGKFKKYDTVLKNREYTVSKEPYVFNDYYLAEVTVTGVGVRTLAVNYRTGESFYLSFDGYFYCGSGLVEYMTDRAFYRMSEVSGEPLGDSAYSFSTELDTSGRKKITEISGYVDGEVLVTVNGESGSFTATVKDGRFNKKVGVSSGKFGFSFSGERPFALKDLKIKYVTGE